MNDNNDEAPIKIIQLLLDNMKLEIKNSQDKINAEINELTKALLTIANKINSFDKTMCDKLDPIKDKTNRMILTVKVTFAMLTLAVVLAVFGSHMLYKHNASVLINEVIKKEDAKKNNKSDLKETISDYLKELNKKDKEADTNLIPN